MTRAAGAAVTALAVAVLAAAGSAAASPARAAGTAGDDVAAAIARAWVPRQRPDGTFTDYIVALRPSGRDVYGTAMLGTALLLHGLRTGEDRALGAGLRALGRRWPRARPRGVIFTDLALALGYAATHDRLAGDPRFRALRARLQTRLRRIDLGVLTDRRPYYNYHLVEATAILVAQATGVRGGRGALGARRARAAASARALIARTLPALGRRGATASPAAGPMALVSDPPSDPPAYHALTLGLLSSALQALGPAAPPEAVALRDRLARATWALMAPDGDVAYYGRSQEQSWTLAFSAYGLTAAAATPGVEAAQAARFAGAADRALERLRAAYVEPRVGAWIAPVLRYGVRVGIRGLDRYASAAAYTGLTLLGLELAAAARAPLGDVPDGPVGADAPGAFRVGRGEGAVALVRTPDVWFAVKRGPATRARWGMDHSRDLRYDAGLAGVRVLRPDGGWDVVLPPRPITGRFDSAGPVLETRTGPARPVVRRLTVLDGGTVVADERFVTRAGRRLRRVVAVRYEPVPGGVRMVVPARPGDRWSWSAFFAGTPRRTAPGVVGDARQLVVAVPAPAAIRPAGRYASGLDPALQRVRFQIRAAGPFSITVRRP